MDADIIDKIRSAVTTEAKVIKFDEEHQVILIPAGEQGFRMENLKAHLPPPDRIRQKATFLSVPALLKYIGRYRTEDTIILANESVAAYEVIFDYHPATVSDHSASSRGDCEHTALYNCPKSDPWNIWMGASGKMIDQVTFATFIETNLREINDPNPADFLQLCLQLNIHKSAEFESELDLGNGQVRFRYQEDIRGSAGNKRAGDIDIPKEIGLQMPVFVDGAVFGIKARFKYRMVEGKLSLGYELIRPREVFEAAVKRVTQEITEGTEAPLFQGAR